MVSIPERDNHDTGVLGRAFYYTGSGWVVAVRTLAKATFMRCRKH